MGSTNEICKEDKKVMDNEKSWSQLLLVWDLVLDITPGYIYYEFKPYIE